MKFLRLSFIVSILWTCMPLSASAEMFKDLKAKLFGPSSYDECILQSMRNVTNEAAANAVQKSCARLFSASAPVSLSGSVYILKKSGRAVHGSGAKVLLLSHDVWKAGETILADMNRRLDGLAADTLSSLRVRRLEELRIKSKRLSVEIISTETALSKANELFSQLEIQVGVDSEKTVKIKAATKQKLSKLVTDEVTARERVKREREALDTAYAAARLRYEEKKGELEKSLDQVRKRIAVAATKQDATMKHITGEQDRQVASALDALSKAKVTYALAERGLKKREIKFLAKQKYEYIHKNIITDNSIKLPSYGIGDPKICGEVHNAGRLAVTKLLIGVYYSGQLLAPGQFKHHQLLGDVLWDFDNQVNDDGKVKLVHTNRYKEKVPGILPGQKWLLNDAYDGCMKINKRAVESGNALRTLEKISGSSGVNWNEWDIRVFDVELADVKSLTSSNSGSSKNWSYNKTRLNEVFANELSVAKSEFEEFEELMRTKDVLIAAESELKKRKVRRLNVIKKAGAERTTSMARLKKTELAPARAVHELSFVPPTSSGLKEAEEQLAVVTGEINSVETKLQKLHHRSEVVADELNSAQEGRENIQLKLTEAKNNLHKTESIVEQIEDGLGAEYQALRDRALSQISAVDTVEIKSAAGYKLLKVLASHEVASARANIEGRFSFANAPRGNFILYTLHDFPLLQKRLWLVHVSLDKTRTVDLGPFNHIDNGDLWEGLEQFFADKEHRGSAK